MRTPHSHERPFESSGCSEGVRGTAARWCDRVSCDLDAEVAKCVFFEAVDAAAEGVNLPKGQIERRG